MLVFLISSYQRAISPLLQQFLGISVICRFDMTCSEYAKQNIQKYGTIKGSYLGFLRLLSCQPFTKKVIYG